MICPDNACCKLNYETVSVATTQSNICNGLLETRLFHFVVACVSPLSRNILM